MSYGKKTENLKADSTFTPITAGERNPGFIFEGFTLKEDDSSIAIIDFSKDGKHFTKRIFESNQDWAMEQASRTILHIATKMGPEEEYWKALGTPANFQEWVTRSNAFMSKNAKGKTFTLKIVYNKNGYLDFPKYPNFCEVDGTTPSTLSTNEKYDNYIKPIGTKAPAEAATVTTDNDMPF